MTLKNKKILYYLPLILPLVIDAVVHQPPLAVEYIAYFIITLVLGRVYCGFLCLLGLMQKLPELIAQKVFKGKYPLKLNGKIDIVLRGTKYLFLGFIIVWSVITGASVLTFDHPYGQLADLYAIFEMSGTL